MTLRVGCVEYINALPLNLPFQLREIESTIHFTYDIPSQLNALLRQKKLDVALSSSVEYLDGDYQMLEGFGISSLKQILSVNLYTQHAVHELSGKRVGVTHHSATSVALLKTLCNHLWKIEPDFEILDRKKPYSHYDAFLLIGDEALANLTISGFQTIDMGAAWHALTALPFVYAVFSIRNEVQPSQITLLKEQLEDAINWSSSHRKIIEAKALSRCRVKPELIETYYSLLNYRLGPKEMEGLELFKKLKACDVQAVCT